MMGADGTSRRYRTLIKLTLNVNLINWLTLFMMINVLLLILVNQELMRLNNSC